MRRGGVDLEPCPDCGAPSWRPGHRFDKAVHCLAWHAAQHPETPALFVLGCRDRTIAKLRAELVAAASANEGQCCRTAVAARDGELAALRVQLDRANSNAKRAIKVLNG
jgi:hypothetical protein